MDDLTPTGREGLLVRAGALASARQALEEQKPGALDSVRRLIHSIAGLGRKYDVVEIRDAITAAELASSDDLPKAVGSLLELLHDVAARSRSRKFEILIIDDDPDISALLRIRLSDANREILVAGTVADADRIISERSLALILLDLHLPDSDGRNLLLRLREDPRTSSIPIVVMTADTDPGPQAECLGLGADEFLEKPLDLEALAAGVSTRLRRAAEIARETQRDHLTGLANRAALEIEFERAQRHAASGTPLALAIVDLDHFKHVNDTYGHRVGDDVLKRTAVVVRRVLRGSDFVCRWGGDELVILLPDTDEAGGVAALEKLLAVFRLERFEAGSSQGFHATFSAGVALVALDASLDDAVAEADRRLYLAKSAGRNCIVSRRDDAGAPDMTAAGA